MPRGQLLVGTSEMLSGLLSRDTLQLRITRGIRGSGKVRHDNPLKNLTYRHSRTCRFGEKELFGFWRDGQSHVAILSQAASLLVQGHQQTRKRFLGLS